MKLLLKRTFTGFLPVYDSDSEKLHKIKIGDIVECEIKKPRNVLFHRKFFAMLNLAFSNQEIFQNFQDFREVITMRAGYYRKVETGKGIAHLPKSISFASMDNTEFEDLFDKVCNVICTEVLPGITAEEIKQELIDFM